MGTLNQKKVAKETARRLEAGERVVGGEILTEAGYEDSVVKNPKHVFTSKGFIEELEKLGFTLEAADTRVSQILKEGEDKDSLKAADLIYKRKGAYAPEKSGDIVQNNFFVNTQTLEAAKQFEETLKNQLYVEASKETETTLESNQGESQGS